MCRRAPTPASSWMVLPRDCGGMPSTLQTRNMGTAQSCDAPNDFAVPMNFDVPLSPSTRLAAPSDSQPGAGHAQPSASLARSKRPGAAVLCALALAASLAACSRQDAAPAAAAKAAPEVGVVTLQKQSQQLEATLPGRTRASLTAEVRPQVSGIVQKRLFTEGALVRQGQQLYQIDAASLRATGGQRPGGPGQGRGQRPHAGGHVAAQCRAGQDRCHQPAGV